MREEIRQIGGPDDSVVVEISETAAIARPPMGEQVREIGGADELVAGEVAEDGLLWRAGLIFVAAHVDDRAHAAAGVWRRGNVDKARMAIEIARRDFLFILIAIEVCSVIGQVGIRPRINAWRAAEDMQIGGTGK